MKLNPHLIPFSTARSYLAVAPHQENDWHRTHPGGLFLRTVRTRADIPFVALLIPLKSNGEVLEFSHFSIHGSRGFDLYANEKYIGPFIPPFDNKSFYSHALNTNSNKNKQMNCTMCIKKEHYIWNHWHIE